MLETIERQSLRSIARDVWAGLSRTTLQASHNPR
jgi:hypothetical protein